MNKQIELARILRTVAVKLEHGQEFGTEMDSNGNAVCSWGETNGALTFSVVVYTSNDSFQEPR